MPLPHCAVAMLLYEEVMQYDVGMALVMFRRSNAYYSVEHACRSYYFWSCTENANVSLGWSHDYILLLPSGEQVCGYELMSLLYVWLAQLAKIFCAV